MSPNQDITLLQQCTLVQTWVDTQGQEERGHGDQAQPRHHGEPHHEPGDRGELCDPPTAPPSTGVILVTSLYRGHYGVLLSLVSPHIIQVTSHPDHHLLITIDYSSLSLSAPRSLLAAGSSLLHVSGSPGPATGLTTQPPVTRDPVRVWLYWDVTRALTGPATSTEAGADQ